MKKSLKRVLALALALTMAVTLLPASALAVWDEGPSIGWGDEVPSDPEPSESPEPSEDPEPSEAPEPTDSPAPSENPEPTEEPDPTDTPQPDGDAPWAETGIQYLLVPGETLYVLGENGRVLYELPYVLVKELVADGQFDETDLQIALSGINTELIGDPGVTTYAQAPAGMIDANRYFNFFCASTENPDSVNLNEAIDAALEKMHGGDWVAQGTLNDVLPQGVTQNYQTHTFLRATVNNVRVHRVGLLTIGGTTYVYYTTEHETTPNTVYPVLNINSETTDDELKAMDDDKIQVAYEHVTGHLVEYRIQVNGQEVTSGFPGGWDKDKFFGDDNAPLALTGTEDQSIPHATVPISVPRGYTGEITVSFTPTGGGGSTNIPIRFEDQTTITNETTPLKVGMERQYSESGTQIHPNDPYETDDRDAFVYVQCTHTAGHTGADQGTVTVTLNLIPYGEPQFSAEWWLRQNNSDTNGMFCFHGLKGQSEHNAEWWNGKDLYTGGNANSAANPTQVANNATAATVSGSGPYTMTWSINGLAMQDNMGGSQGTSNTLIDKLEINGEKINVPVIPEIGTALGGAAYGQKFYEDEATTTLSTGTVVTLKVEGVGRYTSNQQVFMVRTYTLTVTNCYEDITITGGRFIKNKKKQVIVQTEGITNVQTWTHAKMNGTFNTSENWWTQEGKWTADNPAAWWESLDTLSGVIDRTNDNYNGNWFSDPIRFQPALGYQKKPKVEVYLSVADPDIADIKDEETGELYVLAQENANLTQAGINLISKTQGYKAGVSTLVELLNLKSGVTDSTLQTNGTVTNREADGYFNGRYNYIGNTNDGSSNSINLCGWAYLVENSNFVYGSKGDRYPNTDYGDKFGQSSISNWHASKEENGVAAADGFYYLRTTELLDRYMRSSINTGQVLIKITADPILAGVKYTDGKSTSATPDTGELPSNITVTNMPTFGEDGTSNVDNGGDTGEGKLGGYNVVDNTTIYIPAKTPVSDNSEYLFSHWQLVDKNGNPVGGDKYQFQPGQTVNITEMLSDALTNAYTLENTEQGETGQRAVFTLKAVWTSSGDPNLDKPIPVTVNYYMVKLSADGPELETQDPFYSENINAVLGTQAFAQVVEADGITLTDKVEEIIQEHYKGSSTSGTYMLYPMDANHPDFTSKLEITDEDGGVSAANATMSVYIVTDVPVSEITVTKTWTSDDGSAVPSQAYPADGVQVRLQRKLKSEADWTPVGDPVTLTRDTLTHTWRLFRYKDGNKDESNEYEYRVVELNGSDVLEPNETDPPTFIYNASDGQNYEFKVKYDEVTEDNSGTNIGEDDKALKAGITNEYQVPDKNVGTLVLTKDFVNASSVTGGTDQTFTIKVTLTFPQKDGESGYEEWDYDPNQAAEKGQHLAFAKLSQRDSGPDDDDFKTDPDVEGAEAVEYQREGNAETGTLTLTVKDKSEVHVTGLPAGTTCKVEELETDGYNVTYDGPVAADEGGASITPTIQKGLKTNVTVTNVAMGSFALAKQVLGTNGEANGPGADKTQTFQIHVDFTFPSNDVIQWVTKKDGGEVVEDENGDPVQVAVLYDEDDTQYELTSRGGLTYRLTANVSQNAGLTLKVPVGTGYTAHEHTSSGYRYVRATGGETQTYDSSTDSSTDPGASADTTGAVTGTPTTITFVNQRNSGSLTIDKKVVNNAPEGAEFTFTLEFFQSNGTSDTDLVKDQVVPTLPTDATFADGKYTFTLKADEKIEFTDIPAGLYFKVTETNPGQDYFVQHHASGGHDLHEGAATEKLLLAQGGNTVTFTNTYTLTHTVTFQPGDHGTINGESGSTNRVVTVPHGESLTDNQVPGVIVNSADGKTYNFIGWRDEKTDDFYTPDQIPTLTINEDKTFTAQYVGNPGKAANKTAAPGEELTYTITWQNENDNPVRNVVITDGAPAGTTLVEGSITTPSGCNLTVSGGTITWAFDSVPAKGQITVQFTVKVDENLTHGATIENTANAKVGESDGTDSNEVVTTVVQSHTVTFDKGDHGELNGTTSFQVEHGKTLYNENHSVPTVQPDSGYEFIGWIIRGGDGTVYDEQAVGTMTIETDVTFEAQYREKVTPSNPSKTVDKGTAHTGDRLTYTITWTNNTGEAKEVTITDTVPTNTTLVENSYSSGTYNKTTNTITWTDTVAAGETIKVSFTVTVSAQPSEEVTNKASVTVDDKEYTSDEVTTTVTDNTPVTPPGSDTGSLSITKTVSGAGADQDGSFQFHIVLDNKITGTYSGVYFDKGEAVVTIQAGQTVTIGGLPSGTRYTVTELDSGAYTVTSENASGVIRGHQKVSFNNHLDNTPMLNTKDHVAYLIGFTDGTIRPEANITRAEVATIFFRLLTDEAREEYWSQTSRFGDIKRTDWYNNAICTLTNMGILEGKDDGLFHPLDTITKAEFATIAVRFFSYTAEYRAGTFLDVSESAWYADFVQAAADMGLIEGNGAGYFEPTRSITRAEAATIVNRTLGRRPHEDHLLPWGAMNVWPDNANLNAWYYEAMQEATNSHDYAWITEDGETVEQWTEKLEERDWAALEKAWSNAHSAPGGEVMD